MDVVQKVFEKSAKQAEKYKTTDVAKYIEYDLGALMAIDGNELDSRSLRIRPDAYLKEITRDSTQLLINQLWALETHRVEEAIVVKLPKQKFRLPRAKPVPRPKKLTKWEEFAKAKGIVKRKGPKVTWDEQLKKWIPKYGFKRAEAQKEKEWVLEVPQNADDHEDQFAKKAAAKSERVAKNELQRLRNVAKARGVKVPRFGLTNPDIASAKDLQVAMTVARASTASVGKFQDKLPHEKEARGVADITPGASRKRKLQPTFGTQEKQQNLEIIDTVLSKRPKIDINKAVARHINEEQVQHSEERQKTPRRSSGGGRGGKSKGTGKGKPKNPQRGMRKGKVAGGRKRR